MINIEVEVKVNGEPVKVSGKLNDLVAWFITQKLVSDDGATASFASTPKVKGQDTSGRYSVPHVKKAWTDEGEQLLIDTIKERRSQGVSFGHITKEVGEKLERSASSVWTKLNKLRAAGRL